MSVLFITINLPPSNVDKLWEYSLLMLSLMSDVSDDGMDITDAVSSLATSRKVRVAAAVVCN